MRKLIEFIMNFLMASLKGLKEDPRRWDQKLGLVPNALSLIRLFYGLKVVLLDLPKALDEDVEEGFTGKLRPTDIVALKLAAVFVTDFVDGQAARRLKAVTRFGALADTFIDKIVVLVLLVVLALRKLVPWPWPVLFFIFGRELLMIVAKPYVKKHFGLDMSVKQSGKIKMFVQCIAVIMLVSTRTRGPASDFMIAAATTLTVNSLFDYFEEFKTALGH